jgi:hypothetical protein
MMVSPFEIVVKRLVELGFFTYVLPYILTAAIFYGLLRKSEIFGPPERNVAVNGVVALVAALFVWAAPPVLGINLGEALPLFFVQAVVGILIIVVGVLVAAMFFGPNLPEKLSKALGEKSGWWGAFLIIGFLIAFAVFVSSGLVNIMFPGGTIGGMLVPEDILTATVIIILLIIAIGIIGWIAK